MGKKTPKTENGAETISIDIDKNIELPKSTRAEKFPFSKLAVNESFLVPGRTSTLASMCKTAGVRNNATYTSRLRTEADHGEVGCRVWRTA